MPHTPNIRQWCGQWKTSVDRHPTSVFHCIHSSTMSALNLCLFVSLAIAVVAQYYGDSYDDDYPLGQLGSVSLPGSQMQYLYRDAGTIYSSSGDNTASGRQGSRSYAYAAASGSNGARAIAVAPGSPRKPYPNYPVTSTTVAPSTTAAPTATPTAASTASSTSASTAAPTPTSTASSTAAPTPTSTASSTAAPTPTSTASSTAAPTPTSTAASTTASTAAPAASTTAAPIIEASGLITLTLNIAGLRLISVTIDPVCQIGRIVEFTLSQAGGNLIQILGCLRV